MTTATDIGGDLNVDTRFGRSVIVSHDGIVYQKDLGPDTLTAFKNMDRYNPDKSWRPTEDGW